MASKKKLYNGDDAAYWLAVKLINGKPLTAAKLRRHKADILACHKDGCGPRRVANALGISVAMVKAATK